jgi:hypothetical protein
VENKESDIQNNVPEHVLLSTKRWSKAYDCSLKVLLTHQEIEKLKPVDSEYFLFDSFLPVSRVIKIYFDDKEKAQTTLWNIRNGAGFIPDRIVEINSKTIDETASDFNNKDSFFNPNIETVRKNYSSYNRLLGGIAFLRIALSDLFDRSINYPENYISSLSYFNNSIRREFEKTKNKYNKSLHTFFTKEEPILKYLNKTITHTVIEEVATQEQISLTKKFGTSYNLEPIPKNTLTYILCLLHTYGKGGTQSLEDFIGGYFTGSDNDKNESLALIFGIYTGYGSLRNYYKMKNEKINVKFELESKLHSYIIESIFNYVNQGNLISGEFDFIDKEFVAQIKPKRNPDYQQYIILDTLISIRKKDYSEHLIKIVRDIAEEVASFFPNQIVTVNTDSLATHFYNKLKTPFSNVIEQIKNEIKDSVEYKKPENQIQEPKKILLSELSSKKEKTPENDLTQDGKIEVKKEISPNSPTEDLFAGLKEKVRISEQAIKKANTIPKLKELAEKCGINIPSELSKKNEIIDYLLSKCSEN